MLSQLPFLMHKHKTAVPHVQHATHLMKKVLTEMQTLCTGCSKAEPKNFHPATDPLSGGAGLPKFNQLEMVTYLYLQTQFGEDRSMQFRVIMVTDTQTNKHTHKPTDNYSTQCRSFTSVQCNYPTMVKY